MSRNLLLALAALGAVLALALGLLLLADGGGDAIPELPAASRPAEPLDPRAEGANLVDGERGERTESPATVDAAAEPAAGGLPRHGKARTWQLAGRVLQEDGLPARADCVVTLQGLAPVRVDDEGRFRLIVPHALAASGDHRSISVHDSAGETLLRAVVLLQPGLELRLVAVRTLRGRVVDVAGLPVRAASVMAHLPPQGLRESERYLGGSLDVDAEGRFQIPVPREVELPSQVVVRVGFRETTFPFQVARDELTGAEGATLTLDACSFQIRVTGETEPLTFRPEVRLAAWIGDDVESAVLSFMRLDETGFIEVAVPSNATRLELGAGAEGHAPTIELRTAVPCGELWPVHLAPYRDGDVISGVVLGPDGQPVENAFASCNPITQHPEISVPAHQGVRTNSVGSFELLAVQGAPFELRAFETSLGMTREHVVTGGTRDLVLRFDPVQTLTVELHAAGDVGQPVFTLDGFQWGLALERGEGQAGASTYGKFTIEDVPPGEHTLFVVDPIGRTFGRAPVSVFAGAAPAVRVGLGPGRFVQGLVVDAEGQPAVDVEVELEGAPWPAEFHAVWGRARTDVRGRFELLAGAQLRVQLRVRRDGGATRLVTADTDEPVRITLPR